MLGSVCRMEWSQSTPPVLMSFIRSERRRRAAIWYLRGSSYIHCACIRHHHWASNPVLLLIVGHVASFFFQDTSFLLCRSIAIRILRKVALEATSIGWVTFSPLPQPRCAILTFVAGGPSYNYVGPLAAIAVIGVGLHSMLNFGHCCM